MKSSRTRPLRASTRARPPSRKAASTAPVIRVGSRVRVVSGPLAGREGVVEGLDERGVARVRLGQLVARVELDGLVVESGRRPRGTLSTSHRGKRPGSA